MTTRSAMTTTAISLQRRSPSIDLFASNYALEAGFHQFQMTLIPTQIMACLMVFVNGREIGQACCHDSVTDGGKRVTYDFAFVVERPGRQRIEVQIVGSFHGQEPAPVDSVKVEAARVVPVKLEQLQKGSLEVGEPCLDIWGWCSLAWEAHGHEFRVNADYIRQRGIVEPWKWGCNFTQTHAFAYLPWHREMAAEMHAHDFLIDEHGFPPQRRKLPVDGRVLYFRPHVQGVRRMPKHLERFWPTTQYVASKTLNFVKKWGLGFSNVLRHGWEGAIDGFELEEYAQGSDGVLSDPDNLIKLYHAMWSYNPGLILGSCNHTAGYTPDKKFLWMHEGFHGPSRVHVAMDAGSSWKCALSGYDDHVPTSAFPDKRAFENEYNSIFLGYQADSRTYSRNDYGNLTLPDWLIKQSSDFARLRTLGDRDAPASALFWLNDSPTLLPEAIRDYAYIACHDVPRSAVTMNLGSTGLDGVFHWFADAFAEYMGGSAAQHTPADLILRPRENATASTAVLQNNHFRLLRDAHDQQGRLQWDPQGIAHFDRDSLCTTLAHDIATPVNSSRPITLNVDKQAISCTRPWSHRSTLAAGCYRFEITLAEADLHVHNELQLIVNQRVVGLLSAEQRCVNFTLPVDTLCTLMLLPHVAAGASVSNAGEGLTLTSAAITCVWQELASPVASIESVAGAKGGPVDSASPHHHVIRNHKLNLPFEFSPERMQLLDWPVALTAGSYLLAVTASANESLEHNTPPTLRLGLDRHRYRSKFFANLPQVQTLSETLPSMQPVAAYSRIGRVGLLDGKRTYVIPFNIYEACEHVIELFTHDSSITLHDLAIHRMPVRHQFTHHGGALAQLDESRDQTTAGITWSILSDQPALSMTLPHASPMTNELPQWQLLDRSRYRRIKRSHWGITLQQGGMLPDLHLIAQNDIDADTIVTSRQQVLFQPVQSAKTTTTTGATTFHLAVAAGVFASMDIASIVRAVRAKPASIRVADDNKPVKVKAKDAGPVQLVKVLDPKDGPYLVREDGWWRHRGGQPVANEADGQLFLDEMRDWVKRESARPEIHRGFGTGFVHRPDKAAASPPRCKWTHDYLKVYTHQNDALVQRHGYITGVVKAGYGSQYTLAIADVKGDANQARCRVKVSRITAYLFAPRVMFARTVARAWLDGKPWHYFDGQLVMLPQHQGVYDLRVVYGDLQTPVILRTGAHISQTSFEEDRLSFDAQLPPYVRKIPENLCYHAAVGLPDGRGKLIPEANATIVRRDDRGVIIKFHPGMVRLKWSLS